MGWMTVIGDLHGRAPKVRPDSKLVLLAGDICRDRSQEFFMDVDLRGWLKSLPCPVVAVPGNHDWLIAGGGHPKDLPWTLCTEPRMVQAAGLNIFCLPFVLGDHRCFGADEHDYELALKGAVGADVILTHSPPLGMGDRYGSDDHGGSLALRWHCHRHKPKLVCFGHVHEGRGWKRDGETYYLNATLGAGCNGGGYPVWAPYEPWGLADNSWLRGPVRAG